MSTTSRPSSPVQADFLSKRGYVGFTPIKACGTFHLYLTCKDGRPLAVKVFQFRQARITNNDDHQQAHQANLVRDLAALQSLARHANCQRLVESLHTESLSKVYTILEPYLHPDNSLSSIVAANQDGGLCEWNVKSWFPPVALAVRHLHRHGLAHGNLTLRSVLLDEHFNPYLTDYGRLGALVNGGSSVLPAPYSSPQVMIKQQQQKSGGAKGCLVDPLKADSWCLGVIFFTMLNQEEPFGGEEAVGTAAEAAEATLLARMQAKAYRLKAPVEAGLSSTARDVISACLEPEEARRTSVEALCEHPWMPAVFREARMVIGQMEDEYRERAAKKMMTSSS